MDYAATVEIDDMAEYWGMNLDGWMCAGWSWIRHWVEIVGTRLDGSRKDHWC